MIKEAAAKYGACLCGIGSLDIFEGENIQRDPKMILPAASASTASASPFRKHFTTQWTAAFRQCSTPQWVLNT